MIRKLKIFIFLLIFSICSNVYASNMIQTNKLSPSLFMTDIDNIVIPVESIKVSSLNEEIKLYQTKQINASIIPTNATDKDLIYYSDNPKIVSVSSTGLMTANDVGTTYVVVKSANSYVNTVIKVKVYKYIPLESISIKKNMTLNVNSKAKLEVSYVPTNATNKSVIWKSSNPNIATVDNYGNVRALRAGQVEIRAISNDGNRNAICNLKVLSPPPPPEPPKEEKPKPVEKPIPNKPSEEKPKPEEPLINNNNNDNQIQQIESITLSAAELSIKLGTEETLEVIFKPENIKNKKVNWTSSNEEIVKVTNQGKIIPIYPGEAIITATSVEGKKEATCKVTITSSPLEGISFLKEQIIVYENTETNLNIQPIPTDALISGLIWESSDQRVATVDNKGVLKAKKLGTTDIIVTNEDKTINAKLTVKVVTPPEEELKIEISGYDLKFNKNQKNYKLKIRNENSLNIKINRDPKKVVIKGNNDLKNGSIITISISDKKRSSYVIEIVKGKNYTLLFVGIASLLLILNIIRIVKKNKK